MKTIYYYGIDTLYGGMEKFAFLAITEVLKRNKEIQFHIISEHNNFAYKDILIKEYSCKYSILPSKKKHPFLYSKTLKKILKQSNSNCLFHINLMSYRNFLLLNVARKSNIKTIIFGHSCGAKFKIFHSILRSVFSKFGYKIALNEETNKFMFNGRADRIIPNAIDQNLYSFSKENRASIRNKLGIDEDCFLIGQVGRICRQKNQKFSISLVNSLKDSNIKLVLIGKKIENAQLKQLNKKYTILIGETNPLAYYSAFDLLILPSLYEGLSLTLLEAISCDLPIICSDKVPSLENCDNILYLTLKKNYWANAIKNKKISRQKLPKQYSLDFWVSSLLEIYS